MTVSDRWSAAGRGGVNRPRGAEGAVMNPSDRWSAAGRGGANRPRGAEGART